MKLVTTKMYISLIAVLLVASVLLGCSPTKVQSTSSCYSTRSPLCVQVGALLVGVGIAGEGATATLVWNPLGFGYVVRDREAGVLITGHQGEIANGQHPRCLRRKHSDSVVEEWAKQSVLGKEHREVLEVKDRGVVVQREILLRFFDNNGKLSGVAVACTQWGLTEPKLAAALEILDTIDWSSPTEHR